MDVRAVVFEDNRLLLVKEKLKDNGLSGGWADVGYSPAEIAQKEVREESGLEVIPLQLFKLVDKAKHPYPKSLNYVYKLFFYCEPKTFELHPGLETSEARFSRGKKLKTCRIFLWIETHVRIFWKLLNIIIIQQQEQDLIACSKRGSRKYQICYNIIIPCGR